MKFIDLEDKKQFLKETGDIDLLMSVNEDWVPTEEQVNEFVKKRKSIIQGLTDFRKSQTTKSAWRQNRYSFMRGSKRFHRSMAGKKFHRGLGKFLANRMFSNESVSFDMMCETLKAISSLKTHLYIEMEYYHPVDEQIEFEEMLSHLLPTLAITESGLISGELGEVDYDLLLRLVETESILQGIEDVTKYGSLSLEKWNNVKVNLLSKEGVLEEDYDFYVNMCNKLKEEILGGTNA